MARLPPLAAAVALLAPLVLAGCGGHRTSTPARGGDPVPHLRMIARIAREHGGTRAAGTPGDAATARYVATRLRAAGYRVRLQPFDVAVFTERRPPVVAPAGAARLRRARAATLQYSGSGRATGRLRTIPAEGCQRGDFRRLRAGEVALVRRGACFLRDKALLAQAAGAAAALIVNDEPRGTIAGTLQRPGVRIPVVGLARAAGATLRRRGGPVTVSVDAVSGPRRTANVIGERGRGPLVMAGAHLDSVPAGPGVNDDGSGIAAVLAAAERLAARRTPVHLRVGFWAAEEEGLVGSRRYVRDLPAAGRSRIRAYVNLDMVASPRPRRLVYGDPSVRRALERRLPGARRTAIDDRSDHAPFRAAGIPVGGLFSGIEGDPPADPCYHRACDDLSNTDLPSLRRMTRAATAALADLAGRR